MAKQRQDGIHQLGTSKQNLITKDTNMHRSDNSNLMLTEPTPSSTPPVATDQYHHTETIWRVIIDVVTLSICKNKKFYLVKKKQLFLNFSSAYCDDNITFYCTTIYTRIFLFGFNNKISN